MDVSEMSVTEVQQQLARERRNAQLKSWGIVAAVAAAAIALCLVLVQVAGVTPTVLLPVLGLAALVGYGVVGVAKSG